MGKSNLLSKYRDDTFQESTKATIGVDLSMHSLLIDGKRIQNQIWDTAGQERFRAITGHIALYPGLMDRCTVAGETVTAQPGDFYGGWITSEIVGPFKGSPGTMGW